MAIDISKTLGEAFEIVKNNLEIVGLYVIKLVVLAVVGLGLLGINFLTLKQSPMLSVMIGQMVYSFILFMIIAVFVQAIITASAIFIVASVKKKKKISISKALELGIRKAPILFVAGIVAGIITALGFVALIIPGIYLLVRLILYQQACVLEGNLGIKKSWKLTKGHFWDIFVLLIVLAIIAVVLSLIPYIGPLINALFIAPISITAWTLVYLKLKKEK